MDVRAFADELLRALADTGLFEGVALRTEGPIHVGIEPLSVSDIVARLQDILLKRE